MHNNYTDYFIGKEEDDLFGPQPLSERLNPKVLGEDLPKPGFYIKSRLTNKERLCSICGENGHWLPEGEVWVCEHDPSGEWIPRRYVDTIHRSKVRAYDPRTDELLEVEESE